MSERLYFTTKQLFANEMKDINVFESYVNGKLQFYHCVIDATEHLYIMIDENAEWSEVDGTHSHISRVIGEMIENKAA